MPEADKSLEPGATSMPADDPSEGSSWWQQPGQVSSFVDYAYVDGGMVPGLAVRLSIGKNPDVPDEMSEAFATDILNAIRVVIAEHLHRQTKPID